MDDNEKILNEKFEFEGIFADVIEALDRSRDIVCTASKITDKTAEKALFEGVKIILKNCISAIENRENEEDD